MKSQKKDNFRKSKIWEAAVPWWAPFFTKERANERVLKIWGANNALLILYHDYLGALGICIITCAVSKGLQSSVNSKLLDAKFSFYETWESVYTVHSMIRWNLTSKKFPTETEYGVWKLLSCSFTNQSQKNPFP